MPSYVDARESRIIGQALPPAVSAAGKRERLPYKGMFLAQMNASDQIADQLSKELDAVVISPDNASLCVCFIQ
jgi:hypothetical protein